MSSSYCLADKTHPWRFSIKVMAGIKSIDAKPLHHVDYINITSVMLEVIECGEWSTVHKAQQWVSHGSFFTKRTHELTKLTSEWGILRPSSPSFLPPLTPSLSLSSFLPPTRPSSEKCSITCYPPPPQLRL